MPSRRQIRETVVQFLYCADLEGGTDPVSLREPFWEFITESDRKAILISTFRTIHHLAIGRTSRLEEFINRYHAATTFLAAYPEAEALKSLLKRIAELESTWSTHLDKLERIPLADDDQAVTSALEPALAQFFTTDRTLADVRARYLTSLDDFPAIRNQLEPVSGSVRRLQRISDRIRMVEHPEQFPEQADLKKLRESKSEVVALKQQTDQLVDRILQNRNKIDQTIAGVVENYIPERIDPVDRAILRLAAFELISSQAPIKVIINEAIELAKRFGTTDSGRFVNGILDQIAKKDTTETP